MNSKDTSFIPVSQPDITDDDISYVTEVMKEGWISSSGPVIKNFEQLFSGKFGSEYKSIACSNGTAALESALYALNLPKNSEILIPTFTIASCAFACLRNNLKPIFIDCNTSLNMNCDILEERITEKTSCIMIVHIYGLSPNCKKIKQIAHSYNLPIIEDCAESIGNTVQGQKCGTFGDVSCFSFYSNKHMTTGEGGMVLTTNKCIEARTRQYINLNIDNERKFIHADIGCNYRMTSLQAALGISQLNRVKEHIDQKIKIAKMYNKLLKHYGLLKYLNIMPERSCESDNCYWVYPIL